MIPQWWVSTHARKQWVARFRPELTPAEALADLAYLARDVIEVERLRADGRREYMHPSYPLARFVVGAPAVKGYLPTLVTVLDACPFSRTRARTKGSRRNMRRCAR